MVGEGIVMRIVGVGDIYWYIVRNFVVDKCWKVVINSKIIYNYKDEINIF